MRISLGQLFRSQPSRVSLESLAQQNHYPILNAQQLISLLGQENRIRAIRRLASLDHSAFDQLYQPALDSYIESAQLQPASTVDHHAGLGGLIVHTLEVVESAMRERKQYLLPQNSGPEIISREEHCWTYGVFTASLLHDAGKLLTLTRLRLNNDRLWTPVGQHILDVGATRYSIEFINAPYSLQTRVSSMLFHMIPPIGRDMLAQNEKVLSQLTAWLNDDPYEWGILGQIVRKADSQSVAKNLKTGATDRLPNAIGKPLVERMTRALRALIEEGDIKFNRSGAAGWTDGAYAYLVCKVITQKVIDRLRSEGSTDIPSDDTRLFDLWQDHAYLIPTDDDKAVWKVIITDSANRFSHTLTVLKFEANRVIHPRRRIGAFDGTIVEAAKDVLTDDNTIYEQPAAPPASPETEPAPTDIPAVTASATTDVSLPVTPSSATAPTTLPSSKSDETPLDMLLGAIEKTAQPMQPVPAPGNGNTPKDVGVYFLVWLKESLSNGQLKLNQEDALVHIIPEGVALVSPKIFHRFIVSTKIIQSEAIADLDKEARVVQKKLRNTNVLLIRDDGYSIHHIDVRTKNNVKNLNVFLIRSDALYSDDEQPPINPILVLKSKIK